MSKKIVQLNEEVIKGELKELVRGSVEQDRGTVLLSETKGHTSPSKHRFYANLFSSFDFQKT